jgi:hypothetical protein
MLLIQKTDHKRYPHYSVHSNKMNPCKVYSRKQIISVMDHECVLYLITNTDPCNASLNGNWTSILMLICLASQH